MEYDTFKANIQSYVQGAGGDSVETDRRYVHVRTIFKQFGIARAIDSEKLDRPAILFAILEDAK